MTFNFKLTKIAAMLMVTVLATACVSPVSPVAAGKSANDNINSPVSPVTAPAKVKTTINTGVLGMMYVKKDLGVQQGYAKNKEWEWLEKAAVQGNADAQNGLGYLYQESWGAKQNYAKAKALFEQAAAQGNADAQNNLGSMYAEGNGVKQDYAKAKEWYEKAIKTGNAGGAAPQYNLGLMYVRGWGVKKDFAKAKALFEQAAAQGNTGAEDNLELLSQFGLD